MSEDAHKSGDGTVLDKKPDLKPKRPRHFHVILLNDDFTPMDFVVMILMKFFQKNMEEAMSIMLDVHQKGKGVAGTYTLEIAETKAMEVMDAARRLEHPLQAVVEPEGN